MRFFLLVILITSFSAVSQETTSVSDRKPEPVNEITQKIRISWDNSIGINWYNLGTTMSPHCDQTTGGYLIDKYYQVCGWANADGGPYNRARYWTSTGWQLVPVSHPNGQGVGMHSMGIWNNKFVLTGGNRDSGYYDNLTTVLDPIANTWITSTPMPENNLINTCMGVVGNKCYMFGGCVNWIARSNAYSWTPGDSAMTSIAAMPEPRYDAAASVYNGKIYVFGGYYNGYRNTIWEYNPTGNTWSVKACTLLMPLARHSVVTISDRIFIVGGTYEGQNATNTVEIYNPATDTIEYGTSLIWGDRRWRHGCGGNLKDADTGEIWISNGSYEGGSVQDDALRGDITGLTTRIQPTSLGMIKAAFR